jgi:hypothetical protein
MTLFQVMAISQSEGEMHVQLTLQVTVQITSVLSGSVLRNGLSVLIIYFLKALPLHSPWQLDPGGQLALWVYGQYTTLSTFAPT